MIVTPFRARDYLEARAWSRLAGVPAEVVDPLTAAQTWAQGGPAYTGRLDGQVLACAGMLIPWPGLGHAWARISPLGRQHPRLVHFAIRRILGQTIAEQKIRRVEATVALGFDEGRRWIGLLGFVEDGVAEDYLPGGGDAMRYVLLPHHQDRIAQAGLGRAQAVKSVGRADGVPNMEVPFVEPSSRGVSLKEATATLFALEARGQEERPRHARSVPR